MRCRIGSAGGTDRTRRSKLRPRCCSLGAAAGLAPTGGRIGSGGAALLVRRRGLSRGLSPAQPQRLVDRDVAPAELRLGLTDGDRGGQLLTLDVELVDHRGGARGDALAVEGGRTSGGGLGLGEPAKLATDVAEARQRRLRILQCGKHGFAIGGVGRVALRLARAGCRARAAEVEERPAERGDGQRGQIAEIDATMRAG